MEAALYIRVSTEEQATNGISLAAQAERLSAFCAARDWHVARVYTDDAASGKTLDRPALERLLSDMKAGQFDTLVILKLDRLTRSVRDLGILLDLFDHYRVALVSLSESLDASTAAGRLLINLLGSVAQWEREAISERTSLALQHKRSQFRVYGQVPYGFRRAGDRLLPEDSELAVVRQIFRDRELGHSLRKIAERLNTAGICTKKGRTWAAEQIRLILGNTIYHSTLQIGPKRAPEPV